MTHDPDKLERIPPMMARMLRAWERRVAAGDAYDLREMADVLGLGADSVGQAIALNRATEPSPWSWATIGDALDLTRQAAQQRYGRVTVASFHLDRLPLESVNDPLTPA